MCVVGAGDSDDDEDNDDDDDGGGGCILSAVLTLSVGCRLKEVLLTYYGVHVQPAIVNWPIWILDQAHLFLVRLVQ